MRITPAAAAFLRNQAEEESCIDPIFGFYVLRHAEPTSGAMLNALARGDVAALRQLGSDEMEKRLVDPASLSLGVTVNPRIDVDAGHSFKCGDLWLAFSPEWVIASESWTLDVIGGQIVLHDADGLPVLFS